MSKANFWASLSLIFTAVIWGLSYSAQAEAMKSMTPLYFVFWRYLIGCLVLLPVLFIRKKLPDKKLFLGGILCGACLAGGEILQQFGLLYTSAGKAGFLTALYVIMIPLIGIFIKKRSSWKIWVASFVSTAGAFLLCADNSMRSFGNPGDLLMLLCALCFAFQFIFLARFAPEGDALLLAALQFLTVAVLSGTAALFSGEVCTMQNIVSTTLPLLFCGVLAIGGACTIQVVAQKYVHPATASIILSTASVFAVIWGYLLLNEKYSLQNLIGCALIFGAVFLVQFSCGKEEKKEK